MRRWLYLGLLSLVFAVVAWQLEHFLIRQRSAKLAKQGFATFQATLEELDQIVRQKNLAGEYYAYLRPQPGKEIDNKELNPWPRLVHTAVVLDRQLKTLARSGRDLTEEERVLLRHERPTVVTTQGLLRRYPIKEFSGKEIAILALVLKPHHPAKGSALYLATVDGQTVVGLGEQPFGMETSRHLSALLSRQRQEQEIFALYGKNYISTRQYLLPENVLIFEIAVFPPFYHFYSFYLFLALVAAALMRWLKVRHERNLEKKAMSERILHQYSQALSAQEATLEQLQTRLRADIGGEKLVADRQQQELEERLRKAREARTQKTAAPQIVIEVSPEDRQFRFINPAQVIRPKVEAVDPRVEAMRRKAFSSELQTLFSETMQAKPQPPQELLATLDQFAQQYQHPAIDQYLFYLNELYFDEVTRDELVQALDVIGNILQSHQCVVQTYDAAFAAYRCQLVHGLPETLAHYFYLLPQETLIPHDNNDYCYVAVTANMQRNPFFLKRFPPGMADKFLGLHILPINESYLRGRIVFFDTARGGALDNPEAVQSLRNYLRQIAPALHHYLAEKAEDLVIPEDLVTWTVRELREAVAHSMHTTSVTHYVFEQALSLSEGLDIAQAIADHLSDKEKVLIVKPGHFIVAHREGLSATLEQVLSRFGKKFIAKEGVFGRKSRNLYVLAEF